MEDFNDLSIVDIKIEREEESLVVERFDLESDEEKQVIIYEPLRKIRKVHQIEIYHDAPQYSDDISEPPKLKAKRKSMSFGEKLEVIQKSREGLSVKELCEAFEGASKTTISRIIQQSDQIIEKIAQSPHIVDTKKTRRIAEPRLETALKIWIQQQKDSNVKLTGARVQEKAREFAIQFDQTNFKASDGWLEGFKKRHNIRIPFKHVEPENGALMNWMEIFFLPLLGNFSADDIFSFGEFALFYRATPEKVFGMRNNCIDGSWSLERLTVAVGANKSGSEKLPLMVIGKHQQPRCFRRAKSLPTKYLHQPNSWITEQFFEDYMLTMDKKFGRENRHVLFVVENGSAHSLSLPSKLSNIRLVFQMPSSLSPLRLGIVKNLKHFYRKEIIAREVNKLDEGTNEPFDVLNGMTLLAESWENVTADMIGKSFTKAGWVLGGSEVIDESDEIQFSGSFQIALRMLKLDAGSYMDFVCFDDLVATSGELTDDEICRVVKENADQEKIKFNDYQPSLKVKKEIFEAEIDEGKSKRLRNSFKVSTKLEIIEKKESENWSSADLSKEYGISMSSLRKILNSADKLKAQVEKNPNFLDSKRNRLAKEPKLEEALQKWMKTEYSLTRTKVKEKALELAEELGCHDFKASEGWYSHFKQRNNIGQERELNVPEAVFDVKLEDPLSM